MLDNQLLSIIKVGYQEGKTNKEILKELNKSGFKETETGKKISEPTISIWANKHLGLRKMRPFTKGGTPTKKATKKRQKKTRTKPTTVHYSKLEMLEEIITSNLRTDLKEYVINQLWGV